MKWLLHLQHLLLAFLEDIYFHLVPLVVTLSCSPSTFNGDMCHNLFFDFLSNPLLRKTHKRRPNIFPRTHLIRLTMPSFDDVIGLTSFLLHAVKLKLH
jgi:hypothetical protein